MSISLELISKNYYKVTSRNTSIKASESLLRTVLNYEYFYIPERNEVMFASDAIENAYFKNPQEKNICDVLMKNNINVSMFNDYLKQGISNIEYAIRENNEIYLEHTLFVINALYCVYCFGLTNFKYVNQIGFTNGTITFLLMSSFSKYSSERFLMQVENIKKLEDSTTVIPMFLPYVYASFIHDMQLDMLYMNVSVKLSIAMSLKLCESFNLNVFKEYTYANGLYAYSNSIIIVPYFKEIALRCTPKKCTHYCLYYENQVLCVYGCSNIKSSGFLCSYEPSWAYKEIKRCMSSSSSFKSMISNEYENDNDDIIQMRNTGYTELAFKI